MVFFLSVYFLGILSPSDELQYWRDIASKGSGSRRDTAEFVIELLSPMVKEFSATDMMNLIDIPDLIDEIQDYLDELWKQSDSETYSEDRMRHLLDISGGLLGRCIQKKMSQEDLWKSSYSTVKELLKAGQAVCERWTHTCQMLTAQFWKRFTSHPWRGEKFVPDNLLQLKKRLDEILAVRATYEQMCKLLSQSEQQELKLSDSFSPFSGLHPTNYNRYTEHLWKAAVSQYERLTNQAESRVANKLRQHFKSIDGNPIQLLKEFQKYKDLIKRESIMRELTAERENLLGQLNVYIKQYRDEFQQISSGTGSIRLPTGKNLPEIVNKIVWARQLQARVRNNLIYPTYTYFHIYSRSKICPKYPRRF